MSHYRAFISSLLHTSREGKESLGKKNGVWENWVVYVFQKEENTRSLFYCFKQMCHTGCGNGRYKHSKPGRHGSRGGAGFCCTEGWPDDFTAAPRESSFELVQTGPRAAWLLVGWYGQVGHSSSEALLCLPDLSRVPVCVCDAEGTHSVLLNPLWAVCLGGA